MPSSALFTPIGIIFFAGGDFQLKLRANRLFKRLEPQGFAVGEKEHMNENVNDNGHVNVNVKESVNVNKNVNEHEHVNIKRKRKRKRETKTYI